MVNTALQVVMNVSKVFMFKTNNALSTDLLHKTWEPTKMVMKFNNLMKPIIIFDDETIDLFLLTYNLWKYKN